MRLSHRAAAAIAFLPLAAFLGCRTEDRPEITTPTVIPQPSEVRLEVGNLSIAAGLDLSVDDAQLQPLTSIFQRDLYRLTGLHGDPGTQAPTLRLTIDPSLSGDQYALRIGNGITVEGGSYRAVSMGLVTLLQSIDDQHTLPRMEVDDQPARPYRSVMIDLARKWHDVNTLREIIELCKWYKVNYLHLHLTDDQSFTFPSTAFPDLATEGRSYSLEQLRALNAYAFDRGVTLIPEIDVPGHATQMVAKMPDTFGIGDPSQNPFTISMGSERAYAALEVLIGELAAVFTHSPYIHIGGDEAFFVGMGEDPETVAYMAAHDLPNLDELFRHFLIRLHGMVQAHGKETMVWAGFSADGALALPRDLIVMAWESQYYDPQHLVDDGFRVVNASFKPLYVVNNRKWQPDYIYRHWNVRRWESWAIDSDTFSGSEIRPSNRVLGATLCAWEQHAVNELPRLRRRLPAMAARLWSNEPPSFERFRNALEHTDQTLSKMLRPFSVRETGMALRAVREGNFLEHRWFRDSVTVDVDPALDGITLRYALDSRELNPASRLWQEPLTLTDSHTLFVQAFDADNQPVGLPLRQRYVLAPISASASGLWKELPVGSWEKLRFEDSLTIALSATRPRHTIRYTLDGTEPGPASPRYTDPVTMDRTTTLRAQLFDQHDASVGQAFRETYFQIVNLPSLTTGKDTWASNESLAPGRAALATNGRVTLWEQWGGHTDEHVWVMVDLDATESVSKLQVYNFWDGRRYYQYTIDGSLDGVSWFELVDFRTNTEVADIDGYAHSIPPTETRFLRINLLYNSANPGLHLVELSAFR